MRGITLLALTLVTTAVLPPGSAQGPTTSAQGVTMTLLAFDGSCTAVEKVKTSNGGWAINIKIFKIYRHRSSSTISTSIECTGTTTVRVAGSGGIGLRNVYGELRGENGGESDSCAYVGIPFVPTSCSFVLTNDWSHSAEVPGELEFETGHAGELRFCNDGYGYNRAQFPTGIDFIDNPDEIAAPCGYVPVQYGTGSVSTALDYLMSRIAQGP